MTSKERMITAMLGGVPDMVPVAPDTSNMIPCRLTGKPFWDVYLFQDPPLWKAFIDCVRHFGFDGWLPGVPVELECNKQPDGAPVWAEAIVSRTPDRIYTRCHCKIDGKEQWTPWCHVYYIADSPTHCVPLEKLGMSTDPPDEWEDVKPVNSYPGYTAYQQAKEYMGDDGVVGLAVGLPGLGIQPESIYQYYDNPEQTFERCEREHQHNLKMTAEMLALKPDFLLIGISGFMITNPEPIFRELSLPCLQDITRMCKDAGIPSQIHCCGPEYTLVKIASEESDLNSINPLEMEPMGNCDLAKVKRDFGSSISLMGNLHTTTTMLHGSVEVVRSAARTAINAAAEGGGFVLSTGDQCGRDTPDANMFALIETAREFGRY